MSLVKSPRKRCRFYSGHEERAQKKLRLPMTTDSSFGSFPITIIVGEAQKTYFVHETLISNSSSFFSNALKEVWKEGVTRTVELPHVDNTNFQIYVDWLYTGPRLNFTKNDDRVYPTVDDSAETVADEQSTTQNMLQIETPANKTPSVDHEWTRWHQCYELGNYLQDIDFKDALIDLATEKMSSDEEYTHSFPGYIYPTSPAQSPHRKLAVDIAVKVWHKESFLEAPKADHPSEFLADLVAELGSKARTGYLTETSVFDYFKAVAPCNYHEHVLSTTKCYLEKRAVNI
ncbi:hypothetical protein EKO04_006359 [Ascochyta lentis]|uniref:BTB domain-containing protein n=1 Tax=Ascochyta lentis TaxID=205686 RepID=A0A8H7J4W1_9PLEO|nr:hypothetical protein EKO04_006359 [Ascochyta lentis]